MVCSILMDVYKSKVPQRLKKSKIVILSCLCNDNSSLLRQKASLDFAIRYECYKSVGNKILHHQKYRQGKRQGFFVMARHLGLELDLWEKTVRAVTLNSIFEIEAVLYNNLATKLMIVEWEWLQYFGFSSSMKVWHTETEEFFETLSLPLKLSLLCCLEKVTCNDNTSYTLNIVITLSPKSL